MAREHTPHGILTHLLTEQNGGLVALHRSRHGDFVLVGVPGEPLRQVPVHHLSVKRDGGTTTADTREGVLHVPSTLRDRDAYPTWQGRRLVPAQAGEYEIDLSGRPTITPKASLAAPRI